jgi:hypothetical protein
MQKPLILEGTPEQLIRQLSKLPPSKRCRLVEVVEERAELNDEGIAAADAALEQTIVSPGYATGTDKESIDADLMRS